jgi:hypothetical protein
MNCQQCKHGCEAYWITGKFCDPKKEKENEKRPTKKTT